MLAVAAPATACECDGGADSDAGAATEVVRERNGIDYTGWPKPFAGFISVPAVADLGGDSNLDIVVEEVGPVGEYSRVHAITLVGSDLPAGRLTYRGWRRTGLEGRSPRT